MKKIFTDFNISWKFLIIFSILIGCGVGILNRIPILNNTSFQDIAIYLEMWIILALFIIINSKDYKEAISKCFVFFLISQPLIFASEIIIDVVFYNKNFMNTFVTYYNNYYIKGGWLFLTILTIPGSYIAYQVKRNNILSGLILSFATCYLSFKGITDLFKCFFYSFPNHLLNSLICIFMAYYFICILIKNKKSKVLCIIFTSISLFFGIYSFYHLNSIPILFNDYIKLDKTNLIREYYTDNQDIVTLDYDESDNIIYISSSKKIGQTKVYIIDKNGNEYIYLVDVAANKYNVEKIK